MPFGSTLQIQTKEFENISDNTQQCELCQKTKANQITRIGCIILEKFILLVDQLIEYLKELELDETARWLEISTIEYRVLYELWCDW